MSKHRRWQEFREWMRQPPVLMRWKVGVTALAALFVAGGLYFQTQALNEERAHDTACARSEGREAVRLVLFRVTSLSEIFPPSDVITLYEESMHAIIESALPPIVVDDCPFLDLTTLKQTLIRLGAPP